jgi:hypothetical protein
MSLGAGEDSYLIETPEIEAGALGSSDECCVGDHEK